MDLSIIVPCYNEVACIDALYEDLKNTLKNKKISYEIIIIDDGSTDDTSKKIKEIIKTDKNIKLISFSRNFGKEAAMHAGLAFATGQNFAIIDADLQQQPSVMLQMYNKLIDNPDYDVVAAYREKRNGEPALKVTLTSLFYKIINRISQVKILPGSSDFRVFRKSVRDAMLMIKETNRFSKGIFSWLGFNTIYIPYTPDKRFYGSSRWSFISLTKYALGGIISFSNWPIKGLFIVGIVVFLIGLINFILMGNLGFKTIILFISIAILMLGIIALYVSRIHDNVLKRPLYIIKETAGFEVKK